MAPAIEGGAKNTPKPKKLRAMIFDTTIESTQEILKDSPAGVLLEEDELTGWFDAMYKYSGARGAQKDRSFWLQAYNGGAKTVDRIMRGMVHIQNLSVSIAGVIAARADPQARQRRRGRRAAAAVQSGHAAPGRRGQDEPPGQAVFDYDV